jgi:iron complex transport system ATP-binding protein
MLREGRVVAQGPLAEVMTAANLTATFAMSLQLTHEDGRYAARRRTRRHLG